jgi:dihydroneopterin aldolase
MKITLSGAEFFAYHGVYPGEQKIGNCFLVDIDVAFTSETVVTDDNLSSTVNYQELYEIAAEQMKQPRKLIETVAQGILEDVKATYPKVDFIMVTVKKLNPPMGHKIGFASVTVQHKKSDGIQ